MAFLNNAETKLAQRNQLQNPSPLIRITVADFIRNIGSRFYFNFPYLYAGTRIRLFFFRYYFSVGSCHFHLGKERVKNIQMSESRAGFGSPVSFGSEFFTLFVFFQNFRESRISVVR